MPWSPVAAPTGAPTRLGFDVPSVGGSLDYASISGLVARYEAWRTGDASAVTLNGSNYAAILNNTTANVFDLTEATAANQPAQSTINGVTCAQLVGSKYFLENSGVASDAICPTGKLTVFFVGEFKVVADSYLRYAIEFGATKSFEVHISCSATTTSGIMRIPAGVSNVTRTMWPALSGPAVNTPFISVMQVDLDGTGAFTNDVYYSGSSANIVTSSSTPIAGAALADTTNNDFMSVAGGATINFGTMLIYDTLVSAEDIASIVAQLKTDWNF